MADFLSDEWFRTLNDTLANADPVPVEADAATVRVMIEFLDAPGEERAITFSFGPDGARVDAGGDPKANTVVHLTFADALALTSGDIDSASAVRDGRIKVRGDVNAIVPLLTWLQRTHPNAS